MKKIVSFSTALMLAVVSFAQVSKDYTVALATMVQTAPYAYNIGWAADVGALEYQVFSKKPEDLSWKLLAVLDKTKYFYSDTSAKEGEIIEYQVIKLKSNYNAYGYVCVGSKIDVHNYRGKMLLLVDSNYKQPLVAEIAQLQNDLKGDGWQLSTYYIPRTHTPKQVKQIIYSQWIQDPTNVKAVYLLGRIPVPYSGYVGPDGHNDHYGAWPADVYYSVMDSTLWTDYVLNVKVSSSPRNYNVPGDGKFDADAITPGSARLQYGRVDMGNIPDMGNDTLLTQRYLAKAHNFKINKYPVKLRGLIDDNIGSFYGEAFVRGGWASFPGMFGDSVVEGNFTTDLKNSSFMFASTAGFGNYTSSQGVVAFNDLVADSFTCPYTSYFGSYFGDWDNTNNLLRSVIASRSLILTSVWSGRPVAYHHQMALGQTIGFTVQQAVNSPRSLYHSVFVNNGIHLALMGDPSLRLHPITPVTGFIANATCGQVNLSWTASTDTAIAEYRIFRSTSPDGAYTLIGATTGTSYTDFSAIVGTNYYMVRAVRLQKTPSGTYYNMSLGSMDTAFYSPAPKPLVLVNDSIQCVNNNKFVIKNGITNFPNPYTQSWRLDGVPVSFSDSLVRTFSGNGIRYVSLAVSANGCYDSTAIKLDVLNIPSANYSFSQNGVCENANLVVSYAAITSPDYTNLWTFSDGDSTIGDSVYKTFNSSGTFTMSLSVTQKSTGCTYTNARSVVIHPKPQTPNFVGNPFIQLGRKQVFVAKGNKKSSFTWSFSEAPDFATAVGDSLLLGWDNKLLAARVKLVEIDTNGCYSDTTYINVWTIINSANEADNSVITIYPVPTSGNELFIFNHNTGIDIAQLLVTDVSGKTIINKPIQLQSGENILDISQLSGGIYYLTVSWGQYTSTHKIMKLE